MGARGRALGVPVGPSHGDDWQDAASGSYSSKAIDPRSISFQARRVFIMPEKGKPGGNVKSAKKGQRRSVQVTPETYAELEALINRDPDFMTMAGAVAIVVSICTGEAFDQAVARRWGRTKPAASAADAPGPTKQASAAGAPGPTKQASAADAPGPTKQASAADAPGPTKQASVADAPGPTKQASAADAPGPTKQASAAAPRPTASTAKPGA